MTDKKKSIQETYSEIVRSMSQDNASCSCHSKKQEISAAFRDDYSTVEGYVADADLQLGCGIPSEHVGIESGQTVIDLGSGAGNDCFVVSKMVGTTGQVIGIDMTPDMVEKAREHAARLGFKNVRFRLGEIEHLPVTANKADVVISNCVINLVPDKQVAFREIIRILKPGGHFCVSDLMVEGEISVEFRKEASEYAGCVTGAESTSAYLKTILQAGFQDVAVCKRRQVQLPDDLLEKHFDSNGLSAIRSGETGIFSVTVKGTKPSCGCGCKG